MSFEHFFGKIHPGERYSDLLLAIMQFLTILQHINLLSAVDKLF